MTERATSIDELAELDAKYEPAGPRFRLLGIDDLANLPPPSWLVDGWLPDHGLTIVFGATGSLKSFYMLDQALCIAAGVPWHGHEVKQGHVIFTALEGGYGLSKRIEAWMHEHPGAEPRGRFHAVVDPMNLAEEVEALIDSVIQQLGEDADVVLIVIDTTARAMPGSNENSPDDMSAFVGAMDRLIRRWQCAGAAVHHSGWSEKGRERGHSSFPAAADARIGLERSEATGRVTVSQRKMKDFEECDPIQLGPRTVHWCGCGGDTCRKHDSLVLDWLGTRSTGSTTADTGTAEIRGWVLDFVRDADGDPSENEIANGLLGRGYGRDRIKEEIRGLVDDGELHREKRGVAHRHSVPAPRLVAEQT